MKLNYVYNRMTNDWYIPSCYAFRERVNKLADALNGGEEGPWVTLTCNVMDRHLIAVKTPIQHTNCQAEIQGSKIFKPAHIPVDLAGGLVTAVLAPRTLSEEEIAEIEKELAAHAEGAKQRKEFIDKYSDQISDKQMNTINRESDISRKRVEYLELTLRDNDARKAELGEREEQDRKADQELAKELVEDENHKVDDQQVAEANKLKEEQAEGKEKKLSIQEKLAAAKAAKQEDAK